MTNTELAAHHLQQTIHALREVVPVSRPHRQALAEALAALHHAEEALETAEKRAADVHLARVYPPNPPGWQPGR